jgi:transposase
LPIGAKHVGHGYVEQRTALVNRIRGLLSELGIVRREAHNHLEDLPG